MPDPDFELKKTKLVIGDKSEIISYLVCRPLAESGFVNAFSTRSGGVSPLPHSALNLSYKNDTEKNVNENRRRFLAAIQAEKKPVITSNQTHSSKTAILKKEDLPLKSEPDGDAMISGLNEIYLAVKTADCLPILLADPKTGAMATIHAGWKGTAERISEKTIILFKSEGKVDPSHLIAALGPAACEDCYKVGSDVLEFFRRETGDWVEYFKDSTAEGKTHFNLALANKIQLLKMGLKLENIHISSYCTMHNNNLFFSYRAEGHQGEAPVGRQLSLLGRK